MQLKPGDIVACTWAHMWDDEIVKRSRFVVLEVFENDDCSSHMDDDSDDDGDWFLDVDDHVRAYCYDFEGHPEATGITFRLPSEYLTRICDDEK